MESGTKLAHYEISTLLGKGGMGEVWRAKDTKLGREVAIKTLSEEFAKDADRLARFEREAKLLASLNHPNIAAIYGLEEHEGTRFLVLELVEGDTLADRLNRGAIPVEDSLKLALQIADALKAAHDKGVIHRDLKPLNIKVTDDDNVKVLDFGLAKAFAGDEVEATVSNSPTLSMAATQQGMILGTAAYMSPEQAKGRAVDKRTDIFAFGCVLYELLTGRQSFGASDVTESLAAVISLQPDWTTLPQSLHPRLLEVVERCLDKKVSTRFQDIGDVSVDIEKVLADPNGVLVQPVVEAVRAAPQSRLPWVAAFVFAILVTGLGAGVFMQPEPSQPVRLTAVHPGTDVVGNLNDTDIMLSPDGRRFVYAAGGGAETQIYVRALDQLEPTLLVAAGRSLSISPDGQWVGFVTGGILSKVSINGGPTIPIAAIAGVIRGASWGPDETIVFATTNTGTGLSSVSAAGGEPEVLTTPDSESGEVDHLFPQFLPGGRAVLFTMTTNNQSIDNSQIAILDLETGGYEVLIPGGSDPRYAASGHIVYGVAGTLRAVAFDLDSLEVRGTPVPVLEGVVTKQSGGASFSVSLDGTLAYIAGDASGFQERTFVWVDREGREEAVVAEARDYQEFTLSPDGDRIAVRVDDPENQDVWIYDLTRNTSSRLTFDPGVEFFPVWTPDGEHVAFGDEPLSWKSTDGTGEVEVLAEGVNGRPNAFSPDGGTLIFHDQSSGSNIGIMSLEGERNSTLLLEDQFDKRNASFSPDGRWIAYQSNESGQTEVYVRPFPDVDSGYWQMSTDGGAWPLWNPNGQELFYAGPEGMMAVAIETEPTFVPGAVELLFDTIPYATPFTGGNTNRRLDISSNGEQFLIFSVPLGRADETATRPQINIVLNWFEELKERVPVP